MIEYLLGGVFGGLAVIFGIHFLFNLAGLSKEEGVNLLISIAAVTLSVMFCLNGAFNFFEIYPASFQREASPSWIVSGVLLLYAALRFWLYRREVRQWNREEESEIRSGVR